MQRNPEALKIPICELFRLADQVIVHVADERRHEHRGKQPQPGPFAEPAYKGRVEKKFHHDFLEVVIVAVPEFYHSFRQQGLIRVAEHIEAKKTHNPYDFMSAYCMPEHILY